MTSYQKLKLKIKQQDKEIKKLKDAITDDNFVYLSEVKMGEGFQREMENHILSGGRNIIYEFPTL